MSSKVVDFSNKRVILYENALMSRIQEDNPMMNKVFTWFFITFKEDFRKGNLVAFQTLMFLAMAHFFGFYNPKQLSDYLGIPHQGLYSILKGLSLYYLKEMLIGFMVKQAVEHLQPILQKSAATQTRAGITLSVDNSVIDRFGKELLCTWSRYSGRCKKVVNGQDLLGVVLTVYGIVIPLHLLFCSKQGRGNTDKPSLLIAMLKRLKEEFTSEGIDITAFPITFDSWYVSAELRKQLYLLGFKRIIIAGKGNYTFTIKEKKQKASFWKKEIMLVNNQWGIDVPSSRVAGDSPTFGHIVLFFYKKHTTGNYYLMDFSKVPLRGAEIWHIWKQHYLIECFWKILKSTFQIKSMRLQGNGLYTGLLVKVIAYLLSIRLKAENSFSKLTITQIMRKIRREYDLRVLMTEHFHLLVGIK